MCDNLEVEIEKFIFHILVWISDMALLSGEKGHIFMKTKTTLKRCKYVYYLIWTSLFNLCVHLSAASSPLFPLNFFKFPLNFLPKNFLGLALFQWMIIGFN